MPGTLTSKEQGVPQITVLASRLKGDSFENSPLLGHYPTTLRVNHLSLRQITIVSVSNVTEGLIA
jgi:hypothetical protein